jgi:hypothetical protein
MPKVAYGNEEIAFDLDPGDSLTEKEPSDDVGDWQKKQFRQALEGAGFGDLLSGGKILTVVNDAFRPTPTGAILSQIKE